MADKFAIFCKEVMPYNKCVANCAHLVQPNSLAVKETLRKRRITVTSSLNYGQIDRKI